MVKFFVEGSKRVLVFCLVFTLIFGSSSSVWAQLTSTSFLPAPDRLLAASDTFTPVILKGMVIHPDDPLTFDFLMDTGTDKVTGEALHQEAEKSIKYFLAALTVPEEDMWVNLSPVEKDRVVPEALGKTVMGRDLLEQDYILKQISSSLIYPENELGKEFWQKLYAAAARETGSTDMDMDQFNRVWIAPAEAKVWEHDGKVVILKSRLKVMLEADYLDQVQGTGHGAHNLSDQIFRETVLPVIEKEVNEGANFARLRQIYQSMILATWYKIRLKESLLTQAYADKNKVMGVEFSDDVNKDKIYDQYLEVVQKGLFNYIREEKDPVTGEALPRKYFSGGFDGEDMAQVVRAGLQIDGDFPDAAMRDVVGSVVLVFAGADRAQIPLEFTVATVLAGILIYYAAFKDEMKKIRFLKKIRSVRGLARILDHPEKRVRVEAMQSINKIVNDPRRYRNIYNQALQNSHKEVQNWGRAYLETLDSDDPQALAHLNEWRVKNFGDQAMLSRQLLPVRVNWYILRGDSEALDRMLASPDPRFRKEVAMAAYNAFKIITDQLAWLEKVMQVGDESLTSWAIGVLGGMPVELKKEVLPLIASALRDENGAVRYSAIGVLRKLLSPFEMLSLFNGIVAQNDYPRDVYSWAVAESLKISQEEVEFKAMALHIPLAALDSADYFVGIDAKSVLEKMDLSPSERLLVGSHAVRNRFFDVRAWGVAQLAQPEVALDTSLRESAIALIGSCLSDGHEQVRALAEDKIRQVGPSRENIAKMVRDLMELLMDWYKKLPRPSEIPVGAANTRAILLDTRELSFVLNGLDIRQLLKVMESTMVAAEEGGDFEVFNVISDGFYELKANGRIPDDRRGDMIYSDEGEKVARPAQEDAAMDVVTWYQALPLAQQIMLWVGLGGVGVLAGWDLVSGWKNARQLADLRRSPEDYTVDRLIDIWQTTTREDIQKAVRKEILRRGASGTGGLIVNLRKVEADILIAQGIARVRLYKRYNFITELLSSQDRPEGGFVYVYKGRRQSKKDYYGEVWLDGGSPEAWERISRDPAMNRVQESASRDLGGIDLNAKSLDLEIQGQGDVDMPLGLDSAQMTTIRGLTPVIYRIESVDFPAFVGVGVASAS